MIKPKELHFNLIQLESGYDFIYDAAKCSMFYKPQCGFDYKHVYIEKSAYDKAVTALRRIKKSFEVDYYDAKGVFADLEDEHNIAEQALKELGEL